MKLLVGIVKKGFISCACEDTYRFPLTRNLTRCEFSNLSREAARLNLPFKLLLKADSENNYKSFLTELNIAFVSVYPNPSEAKRRFGLDARSARKPLVFNSGLIRGKEKDLLDAGSVRNPQEVFNGDCSITAVRSTVARETRVRLPPFTLKRKRKGSLAEFDKIPAFTFTTTTPEWSQRRKK